MAQRMGIPPSPVARRGIVLIFVAGILTILAAMGTAFFAVTQSSTLSAVRYADMVRGDLLARAGMSEAIARLRAQAFISGESPCDSWYMTDWLQGAAPKISYAFGDGKDDPMLPDGIVDNEPGEAKQPYTRAMGDSAGEGSDRFFLEVEDAASKINVNACDNLAVVLDNLCRLIGPPLVAADQNMLQPRRWYEESGNALPEYNYNAGDTATARDLYYSLDAKGRPVQKADGTAVYGDGYAIAGYRARSGRFLSIDNLKEALTFVDRNGNGIADDPLEVLELEAKLAALRPHLTTDSWVDPNTVCVGKFEWVADNQTVPAVREVGDRDGNGTPGDKLYTSVKAQILIDRDKSWVADDPVNDPYNTKGSLRGCYVSILNGHGSGQLRRIATNGADWIAIWAESPDDERMTVPPGPISSYMIIPREDALLTRVASSCGAPAWLPITTEDGRLVDDPRIDYVSHPLCIFRAPVNINTASDKVLAALFMGINVQHGHPMALGTNADLDATHAAWKISPDPNACENEILTFAGLKRVPVSSGKLDFDDAKTIADVLLAELKTGDFDLSYITNHGRIGLNEAHELAARIVSARQRTKPHPTDDDPDPFTANGPAVKGYQRGPFKSWDDLYFRVIKPWDDIRSKLPTDTVLRSGNPLKGGKGKQSVARMLMAAFNSNTDILKFNPNIEWIDRWGRNFTEMEPVMIYTNDIASNGKAITPPDVNVSPTPSNPLLPGCEPIFAREDRKPIPGYSWNPVWLTDFRNKDQSVPLPGGGTYRGGAYIIRSQRYKSDELIDKTDLNRSTTEFSFHSNGVFRIASTGQIVHGVTKQLLTERKLEAVVKVYDVWRESTQADFVRGEFMEAAGGNQGSLAVENWSYEESNRSGKVTRDGVHTDHSGSAKPIKRLSLNTQPEPLVPLMYRLTRPMGSGENEDKVDTNMRDAWGNPRRNPVVVPPDPAWPEAQVPDILANRVLPARYDGQLVLAVNTPRFDRGNDTFLATFTGDLDTTTSAINGREQSKMPHTPASQGYRYRVVDTFGLLGLLNDTLVDVDPELPNRYVYCFKSANTALVGLDTQHYYNNCSVRMGDLRSDGVFLSNTGVSGNDGTLKYCFSRDENSNDKSNFNPNDPDGFTISMWAKTTWWEGDNRRHEFFNASNPGWGPNCRACFLTKDGRYYFSGNAENGNISNQGQRRNDLTFLLECPSNQHRDIEYGGLLNGDSRVKYQWRPPYTGRYKPKLLSDKTLSFWPESPSYYVQPFRWCFLGGRATVKDNTMLDLGSGSLGHWKSDKNVQSRNRIKSVIRPFISTSLLTEKGENHTSWAVTMDNYADLCWTMKDSRWWDSTSPGRCDIGNKGPTDLTQGEGQGAKTGLDAAFDWADIPAAKKSSAQTKVFAINNLNYGRAASAVGDEIGMWQYRQMPDEGTYAVIDALKISKKANLDLPADDRVLAEMTTSRYYLPANPATRSECPWFVSQTLSEFMRGNMSASESVTPVRVTWSGFGPRFYYEERQASGTYKRDERITFDRTNQKVERFNFKGPFDIKIYNDDDATVDYGTDVSGRIKSFVSVERPSPADYQDRSKARKDPFEVELLRDAGGTLTVLERMDGLNDGIFDDPTALNALKPVRLPANQLRYRVRFRYYRDPLVDPTAAADGTSTVNADSHYLLDTPVFDDISITYFTQVRFLDFKAVNE